MKCKHRYSDRRTMFRATARAKRESIMLPGELLPQQCSGCATRYPCTHECEHIDCAIETGRALPEWIQEVKREVA